MPLQQDVPNAVPAAAPATQLREPVFRELPRREQPLPPLERAAEARRDWIDCWKAMGMLLVVAGHVLEPLRAQWIFWFHMPLFFWISGYLYRHRPEPPLAFARRKALHLLVPYVAFLLLLSLPRYWEYAHRFAVDPNLGPVRDAVRATARRLYGGRALVGWFGVFWFVTCLFLCQQVYHVLFPHLRTRWRWLALFAACFALAMVDQFVVRPWPVVWNADVVPMALIFYALGHLVSLRHVDAPPRAWLIASAVVIAACVGLQQSGLPLRFDMKASDYGVPGLSVVLAVACIVLTWSLARRLGDLAVLRRVLLPIAGGLMVIMYLHQFVNLSMVRYPPLSHAALRMVAAVGVPLLVFGVIKRVAVLRTVLLGEPRRSAPLVTT